MPTIALTATQRRTLDRAVKMLEDKRGKKFSRGEAIGELAQFAREHQAEFVSFLNAEKPGP